MVSVHQVSIVKKEQSLPKLVLSALTTLIEAKLTATPVNPDTTALVLLLPNPQANAKVAITASLGREQQLLLMVLLVADVKPLITVLKALQQCTPALTVSSITKMARLLVKYVPL